MGKDGHPRKAKAGEDPYNIGLSLEYVFGGFVSSVAKARDSAQLCLGEHVLTLPVKLSRYLPLSIVQKVNCRDVRTPAWLVHALTVCSSIVLHLPTGRPLVISLLSSCFCIFLKGALPANRLTALAKAQHADPDM